METDSCARASCQKAPLFDTRESIGEKSVAHVPGFFRFFLKSASPEKPYRLLQQSEESGPAQVPLSFLLNLGFAGKNIFIILQIFAQKRRCIKAIRTFFLTGAAVFAIFDL